MNALYILFAVALAVVSIFTGEVVTYIALGFILMALHNILQVLKEISAKLDRRN
ncbi:hypothetical protein [Paenibacillus tarimensis]|uniref:hypothetical protein n=1 Tax=Paenibacillus tarimensis TaxID=416012 RepID=UPI001F2DF8E2|nr:hypothetical protein [Paenibacillus tarimensis]MCF2946459.1 hypothetical protein [Paenibacillus tarimensis]